MKKHVLHPLWVAIGLLAAILIAREIVVPDDFGVHGQSFTYNFHRLSNEQEWKDFPVKYRGRDSCAECHKANFSTIRRSPHKRVQCENCHGPAGNHPDDVEYLPVNRNRELCLRCHAFLDYPETARAEMPTVKNRSHKHRLECVQCHNPHDPRKKVQ